MTAVQFLTRLPAPAATDYRLGRAAPWFPLVGALLGSIVVTVDAALRWLSLDSTRVVVSTVDVIVFLALTGGLHADGLIDTCDAVFSHATPERRLEIMKDPRVGSFGTIGAIGVVLLKVASLAALADASRLGLLVLAPSVGRWCLLLSALVFPYGRPGGSGEPLKSALTPLVVGMAGLLPLCLVLVAGWPGALGAALAIVVTLLLGRWLVRLLPGLTGDCYGAICEVAETTVWLGAALALPRLGG